MFDPLYIDISEFESSILILTEINYTNSVSRGSTINVRLNVPIVANETIENIVTPDQPFGIGLCWLACISSIAAYMKNTTPDNPEDLFNDLYELRDVGGIDWFGGYDHPEGIEHFENVYINRIYQLGLDCHQNGLDFYDVVSLLNQDIPIYAGILVQAGDDLGHAVVICGAYYDSANNEYYYTLMDANEDAYVSIVDSSPLDTTFTYNPNHWSMPTFYYWTRCYY